MFCRSCGNQLADNAKFCNMCGNKVVKLEATDSFPSPVIPDPEPVPMPAEQPVINDNQDNGFFQQQQPVYKPYEPAYQQPIAQPVYKNTVYTSGKPAVSKTTSTVYAVIMYLIAAFLVASPFLHMYGDKTYHFGSFSNLHDLSKVSGKNIFSTVIDIISDGSTDYKLFYIGLSVHIIFEICALIFLLIALFRLLSKRQDKILKVLSDLRLSVSLSFFGIFTSVGLMTASYLVRNKFSGLFSNVFYIFTYVFVPLSLIALIVCCIFVGQTRRAYAVNSAYNQPAPQQPYGGTGSY